jgi:hypothetical protein
VSFTALYKNTRSVLLCVLSHAWFNGCMGLAVYIGANGVLQLALGWRAIVVSLELIGGIFFALQKKAGIGASKALIWHTFRRF